MQVTGKGYRLPHLHSEEPCPSLTLLIPPSEAEAQALLWDRLMLADKKL